jgi:transposase
MRTDPSFDLNIYLRDMFVTMKNMSEENKERYKWTFRTKKRIREHAIMTLVSSIKSNLTKIKTKQIKRFLLKPKSKGAERVTIDISHDAGMVRRIDKRILCIDGLHFKCKEDLPETINHNIKLSHDVKSNIFSVIITEFTRCNEAETSTVRPTDRGRDRIVAIDPGINIYSTYYCPDGEWGELGSTMTKMLDMCYLKEKRMKRYLKHNPKKLERALRSLERRKNNRIDDFQWKACHFFLSNFERILISRLYITGKKIKKIVKRKENDIRQCRFVDRLQHKSLVYPNRSVHVIKEHGTSSLCTSCLSADVVKDTTVRCRRCKLTVHRDLAGARNILLKHLL